jgi:ATP-binding cassette subfamily F protein 3
VLSGGERNRLALAKLLIEPANCLLLDEPTNHLDLTAKEVLLEALLEYTGTVVLVAHDRYILDRLPQEIIEVGHGTAIRYLGNYEDYLAKKAALLDGAIPSSTRPHAPARSFAGRASNGTDRWAAAATTEGTGAISRDEDRQAARRQARAEEKRRREVETIESTISEKEAELAALATTMNDPTFYQTHPAPQTLFSSYARLKREVELLYERLERVGA